MTSLKEIRENGLGSNFKVVFPEDGYRKDNTVWFGTCATCGERVTNSLHTKVWTHTVVLETKYHESGNILSQRSKDIDYCPEA